MKERFLFYFRFWLITILIAAIVYFIPNKVTALAIPIGLCYIIYDGYAYYTSLCRRKDIICGICFLLLLVMMAVDYFVDARRAFFLPLLVTGLFLGLRFGLSAWCEVNYEEIENLIHMTEQRLNLSWQKRTQELQIRYANANVDEEKMRREIEAFEQEMQQQQLAKIVQIQQEYKKNFAEGSRRQKEKYERQIQSLNDRMNQERKEQEEKLRSIMESHQREMEKQNSTIRNLQGRLNGLIAANKKLAESADDGQAFSALEKMRAQMEVINKDKKRLEQELDKKKKELVTKKEELEKEKQMSHLSQENIDQLKRKLEQNGRELEKVENDRKKLTESYEDSQKKLSDMQKRCMQLQESLDRMQQKFSKIKARGIDLDAPDALKKFEEYMHDATKDVIDSEKDSFQKKLAAFQKEYPLYNKEVINDLATGELLRERFSNLKKTPSVDFSPALLPALVMLERVMREYYVKKGYLHHKAVDCPWAQICNDVKKHEYNWRPGFGDELLDLKSVRNQAVHKGNIDYATYEDSYGKIVHNPDSVIRFIYDIVTAA